MEGEYLVVRTEAEIVRVYLNPFMDIPLLDFPVPDEDVMQFLLELNIPTSGDVVQYLRTSKMHINHLDCLSKPNEAKQKRSTNTTKIKTTNTGLKDELFTAIAGQIWDNDGVLPNRPSGAHNGSSNGQENGIKTEMRPDGTFAHQPSSNSSLGSTFNGNGMSNDAGASNSPVPTKPLRNYGSTGGQLTAKQMSDFELVFDRRTNVDEWELVRKAVYVISKWFGADDFALVVLGAFLELRKRNELDLYRLLGFMPNTTADEKASFSAAGFPDITDAIVRKEKKEIRAKLSLLTERGLLRSQHMSEQQTTPVWIIDLLEMFNVAIYRIQKLKSRISENLESLKSDLMYCPQCNAKYGDSAIGTLLRRGNNYLCHTPCNTILQLIDTQDLADKYSKLQKKIPLFQPLSELLSHFRNRDKPKSNSSGSSSSKSGSSSTSSSSSTNANRSKKASNSKISGNSGIGAHGPLAAQSRANNPSAPHASANFARHEPPSFMVAMVNTQSAYHQRIQDSTPEEVFNIHPISFGDPSMEDYRVFIPVIDDRDVSDREVGFRCAKLLLDNIADFLHMVKLEGNSFYHYCYNMSLRSLFIAHKRGFRPTEIIRFLNNLSTGVPPCIVDRVMNKSQYVNYYPAVMVLVKCRYFIKSDSLEIVKKIRSMEGISSMLCGGDILKTEDSALEETFYWLEVARSTRANVKEKALGIGIPIIDEISFVLDSSSIESEIEEPAGIIRMKKVPVVLTRNANVRDYQSMSCSKLYWDSFKGHSGILILPCGAGKTLIGITAMATLQQPCIIFCQSTLAATQWVEQIKSWTNLSQNAVSAITSMHKDRNPDAEVVVTTYAMFAGNELNRKDESMIINRKIQSREWGIMILDEVHQAPAETFKLVTGNLICHLKLGLTATLVREDAKVSMLPSLVGPTLYELDVSTLRKHNYIAPIECHEIRLPFTPLWKRHYTNPSSDTWTTTKSTAGVVKELLFTTNPNKMLACMTLIQRHLKLKHKIVIFCDDLIGLECYAKILSSVDTSRPCPVIHGKTPEVEKERIVKEFRDAQNGDWLLFSKVGDMSIDLPEARVLIQIAAAQGSRMQEGQRVGRIQRRFAGKTMAYAYSLVSGESPAELGFALRRRNYLEDHGYSVTIHEMSEQSEYVKTELPQKTEEDLVTRIREMLIERTRSRTGEGKAQLKADREAARKKAGFKRQANQITPVPSNPLDGPRDRSLMKALKKFRR